MPNKQPEKDKRMKHTALLFLIAASAICSGPSGRADAFAPRSPVAVGRTGSLPLSRLSSFSRNNDWSEELGKLREIENRNVESSLIDSAFALDEEACKLLDIQLAGQVKLALPSSSVSNGNQAPAMRPALVLVQGLAKDAPAASTESVVLPLVSTAQLQLVCFARAKRSLSKSVMLQLNLQLVNRDNALFDNLPWSTWSVDPQMRNRDAAGNSILEKFHLGKRDAYNRFMGKDWQGRSLAIGNMALRLKYALEESPNEGDDDEQGSEANNSSNNNNNDEDLQMDQTVLAKRILELEIRETKMDLAGVDSEIASTSLSEKSGLMSQREALVEKMSKAQNDLEQLNRQGDGKVKQSVLSDILDKVASWTTNDGQNAAPYRGATGYAPMLDTTDDLDSSLLPYSSPYDMLKEILEDQLNAKVIGCVLENTSLLRGNTVLGGVVVLQRIVAKETVEIMGETMEISNAEQEYGNAGVRGGEVLLVECDADEAVAVSEALEVPLRIESTIMDTSSSICSPPPPEKSPSSNMESSHIYNTLPVWTIADGANSLQVEGVASPADDSASPISIPRTTTGITEMMMSADSSSSSSSSQLFPTDNPVKTIEEFDSLSNEDKAKTLLEMSNFQGRLPRPRTVKSTTPNPLDGLMLPLIDESVRREVRLRQAKADGDADLVEQLENEKSKYQRAREAAKGARERGVEEAAEEWDEEAALLESLRADITQDEGAYSRFLDKDDWYERDRQATAQRIKRSSFGSLLDGIE